MPLNLLLCTKVCIISGNDYTRSRHFDCLSDINLDFDRAFHNSQYSKLNHICLIYNSLKKYVCVYVCIYLYLSISMHN